MKTDIINNKYGRLTVVKKTSEYSGHERKWSCLCICGNTVKVRKSSLLSGTTKSCGCLKMDIVTKHGMTYASVYASWQSMRVRCNNKNKTSYKYYGGRGIKICKRWSKFENFYADMGDRPKGKTLDRINNDKGYYPENCRWATAEEQNRNRRNSVRLTYDGKNKCIYEWSDIFGIKSGTIKRRISRGWSVEKALTTSVGI